jgi:hypothetical protein
MQHTVRSRALSLIVFISIAFATCGAAVTGYGLGAPSSVLRAAAALTSIGAVGQSNATGRAEGPFFAPVTTSVVASDLQFIDYGTCIDAGTCYACVAGQSCYNDASSPTLKFAPYQHVLHNDFGTGVGQPPSNEYGGESLGAGFFTQVHTEASGFTFLYHTNAVSGACLADIDVGTTAWNYFLLTAQAAENRALDAGFQTHFVGANLMVHGECDCQKPAYGPSLPVYQANLQTALLAITGNRPGPGRCPTCIPLMIEQMNTNCGTAGSDYAATEQLNVSQDPVNAGHILGCGTTYQLPFCPADVHRKNYGHREESSAFGECYLAYEQWQQNGAVWPLPVAPSHVGVFNSSGIQSGPSASTFVRSGDVVTINFDVPSGEYLVVDSATCPTNHQAGTPFSMWANGLGFEGWTGVTSVDGGMPGLPAVVATQKGTPISTTCAVTGAAQVQCTFASPPDLIAYAQTPDGNTLLDGGTYDGGGPGYAGPPNGLCGWLRTNYSRVNAFGDAVPIQHWAWEFVQGGPF